MSAVSYPQRPKTAGVNSCLQIGRCIANYYNLLRIFYSQLTSYFPLDLFPDILQHFEEIKSVSQLMKEVYSCDHIRRCTYVSARQVRPQDARLLRVALNQSILLVESINEDQKGRVIEYGVTRFRGDDMKLVLAN